MRRQEQAAHGEGVLLAQHIAWGQVKCHSGQLADLRVQVCSPKINSFASRVEDAFISLIRLYNPGLRAWLDPI